MKSWKVFICSMFVLALIAWAAVGSAEDIVIGYSGPLSGPAAEYGQDCVNGIDMAINEINAAGGITLTSTRPAAWKPIWSIGRSVRTSTVPPTPPSRMNDCCVL